jgi:hypothetical protein
MGKYIRKYDSYEDYQADLFDMPTPCVSIVDGVIYTSKDTFDEIQITLDASNLTDNADENEHVELLTVSAPSYGRTCKVNGVTTSVKPTDMPDNSSTISTPLTNIPEDGLVNIRLIPTQNFNENYVDNHNIVTFDASLSKLETIGDSMFENCVNLSYVFLPDTVSEIGESAFAGCRNLDSVEIPNNVNCIKTNTFNDCNLGAVTLPYGVSKIETMAFGGEHSMYSITFPETMAVIEAGAFDNCPNLYKLIFLGTEPPQVHNESFNNSLISVIYVPKGSARRYKKLGKILCAQIIER